ncbi:MAG: DoxX family protein [Bdellovibrionales bacterium]
MKLKSLFAIHFGKKLENSLVHWALLITRVLVALLMLRHGFGKLMGFENIAPHFPDPLGVGSTVSLVLVIGSEFFASLFLLFGFLTRWSVLTTFITMLIAAFMTHGPDPFEKKELALLYAVVYLLFLISGAGKYSLDFYFKKKFRI